MKTEPEGTAIVANGGWRRRIIRQGRPRSEAALVNAGFSFGIGFVIVCALFWLVATAALLFSVAAWLSVSGALVLNAWRIRRAEPVVDIVDGEGPELGDIEVPR